MNNSEYFPRLFMKISKEFVSTSTNTMCFNAYIQMILKILYTPFDIFKCKINCVLLPMCRVENALNVTLIHS